MKFPTGLEPLQCICSVSLTRKVRPGNNLRTTMELPVLLRRVLSLLFGKWRDSIKVLLVLRARVFPLLAVLFVLALAAGGSVGMRSVTWNRLVAGHSLIANNITTIVLYHLPGKLWRKTVPDSRSSTPKRRERCLQTLHFFGIFNYN